MTFFIDFQIMKQNVIYLKYFFLFVKETKYYVKLSANYLIICDKYST